jgi:hypothetical protein
LLISCSLAGADNSTEIFLWHDSHNEQNCSSIDAKALNPLLEIIEPVVEHFDLARILWTECWVIVWCNDLADYRAAKAAIGT